ncbi:YeeE/YedE family protein, partial [Bacteriovorax sp. DB6_IX]|uniref:YeeE/YedE family protein n=1 Tax=Bacteriovorax sp. DB6_IX TaxID=1353530 RepID=UPI00038A484F
MEIVNFTPVPSLIGGLLIGLASTILLLMNGRIAGISGITKSIFQKNKSGDSLWRILFFVGLILGGVLFVTLSGYELS